VVIPTLAFSLLQSKLVLPSHLAALSPIDPDRPVGWFTRFRRRFTDGLERFVERIYLPALSGFLRQRYLVVVAFVCLFLATVAAVGAGWVRFQFFPEVEAEIISAKLQLPNGVPFSDTGRAIDQITAAAAQLQERFRSDDGGPVVRHVLASTGAFAFSPDPFASGTGAPAVNIGDVTLELSPAASRSVRSEELTAEWRRLTGPVPGAVELAFQSIAAGGGNAIDLQLAGQDTGQLEEAVAMVKAALAGYAGVIDIADNNLAGKRELKLAISPAAEALGLRLDDLARQVRQGFYGEEVQRLQRGRDEVKVMVRYPESERKSLADIEGMKVRLPDGSEVPFREVATVEYSRGYSSIERADRRRAVTVTADLDKSVPGVNANEVVASLERGVLREVTAKFPGVTYSFEGEQKDQRDSVRDIGTGFVLAMLGMYVLLAIPLRSYFQPAIIMSVIPFGVVGAVFGHVVMGLELSIMSMCGIVALAGVVVNDSLVLVDYVNRERGQAASVVRAAWEAGGKRFRPILLTSLTTFAGLLPMLLETDLQARFLVPMAVSLAFGILFATAITLVLVPSLYLILEDIKRLFLRRAPAGGPARRSSRLTAPPAG
jgi:multidrug efflux pump subunit AcrB